MVPTIHDIYLKYKEIYNVDITFEEFVKLQEEQHNIQ
jgi:hypothetical protein